MSDETIEKRDRMVETQIAARGVADPLVLEAMRRTPRDAFVSEALAEFAFDDTPLPIEEGQTISQPYIVALMLESLELDRDERVLEVGAGSGYAAAVLGAIVREVWAIERHPLLAEKAAARMQQLHLGHVHVVQG